jgi:hypothetical protein
MVQRPVATAFLVSSPPATDPPTVYAVTARHVIEGARAARESLFVRVNLKAGKPFEDLPIPDTNWVESRSSDVSVARMTLRKDFDVLPLDTERFVTDEFASKRQLGPGDDVFFMGLFSLHHGRQRSQPIARFGNLSLMPEPVRVVHQGKDAQGQEWRWEQEINGYLVEARSWGGVSGSPAFVYFPADRFAGGVVISSNPDGQPWAYQDFDDPPQPEHDTADQWPKLLGIVSSHFDITQDVALSGDVFGEARVQLNAGIAVVVPAQDIMELL